MLPTLPLSSTHIASVSSSCAPVTLNQPSEGKSASNFEKDTVVGVLSVILFCTSLIAVNRKVPLKSIKNTPINFGCMAGNIIYRAQHWEIEFPKERALEWII